MLATVEKVNDKYVARFERHLKHPVEKVWSAITEPEKLAKWLAEAAIDLKKGGKLELTFSSTEGNVLVSQITDVIPMSVFEFTWDDDLIRFELYPEEDGCLLILKQIFDVVDEQVAKDLAGWHVHTDVLLSLLDGEPSEFSYARWEELYTEYRKVTASISS